MQDFAFRVGHGYDAHRLCEGRKLILGGAEIEYPLGLMGHSDADVLTHAVMDALLGASGLGDIGIYFPASDPEYIGISSLRLLEDVSRMLAERGFSVGNIDATIVCQSPRLSSYLQQMKRNIAGTLCIREESVNVKATTEEGMGFTGGGEGIAAHAVCIVVCGNLQ